VRPADVTMDSQTQPARVSAADPGAAERLPLAICVGFGIGSLGISILLNVVTTFFPVLMTTVLGQSAAVAGALLTISKLYDILADIVIGAVSDRTRSRWGRRRPYLLAGAVIASLSLVMIFMPPSLGDDALLIYMGAGLILYSTGYALFAIPYMAMSGEMTDGYHERTRLFSFRAFFAAAGQILSSAGTAWLIQRVGGGSHGYAVMGAGAASVLFAAMVLCFIGTAKARRAEAAPRSHVPRLQQLRSLLDNRPFVLLMLIKINQFMAIAAVGTTKLLFLLNVLHIGYTGLVHLTLVQNVVAAATVPAWVWFARRVGKRQAYLCATGLLCFVYLSWVLTGDGVPIEMVWLRGALNGLAATGTTLMSAAMLPDVMEFDRIRTGHRREGVFSSIYTIVEKVGYAIGPGLIGALLATSGFIATTQGRLVEQPESAIRALYFCFAVLPAGVVAISFVLMLFYRLDESVLRTARNAQAARS
jgi:glycoside/pentoside/hexuronide:cation symporter, GPH family